MDERTAQAVRHALAGQARNVVLPDGQALDVVTGAAVATLAAKLDRSLRRTELAALETGFVPARYQRNMTTYSPAEQAEFLRARALIVGLGGLGGYLLEILVRAGLGRIVLSDPDALVESNLNRQILSTRTTLGNAKAKTAADRAYEINPAVEVTILSGAFDTDIQGAPSKTEHARALEGADMLADCLGGLSHRDQLARAARRAGIPLVTAAAAGQAGWVATVMPDQDGPVEAMNLDAGNPNGQEAQLGVPAPAIVTAAALQAQEVLALACGRQPALAGKILLFDLERMDFETVSLA